MATSQPQVPKEPEAIDLFTRFESSFPVKWRENSWYICLIGALIGSAKPTLVGPLYTHLIARQEHTSPSQRQTLVRRMREALMKCIMINGIPSVMEAVHSLSTREAPEDRDGSFSREGWRLDGDNKQRAKEALRTLYRADLERIAEGFASHRDVWFVAEEISYGLFLANYETITFPETEMVVLAGVMCQNLRGPTLWHLRGCIRVGMEPEEVKQMQKCIEMVAEYAGRTLDKVGKVDDIREELHDAW